MPKYRITYPDGKKYDVTVPEGWTREQALQQVERQRGAQQSAPPQRAGLTGALENIHDYFPDPADFAKGATKAAIGAISRHLPDPAPMTLPKTAQAAREQGQQQLRQWTDAPGNRTEKAGRIATEVAPFVVQPEILARLGFAKAWPTLAAIADRALWGAAGGAATAPEGGRLESGAIGGALGAAIPGAGAAAGRIPPWLADQLARAGGYGLTEYMLPFHHVLEDVAPWWLMYRTRLGDVVGQAGQRVPGLAATAASRVPTGLTGAAAGEAVKESESNGSNEARSP